MELSLNFPHRGCLVAFREGFCRRCTKNARRSHSFGGEAGILTGLRGNPCHGCVSKLALATMQRSFKASFFDPLYDDASNLE